MSVSKMTKTRVSIEDEQAEFSWQFSESLSAPGNGSSVLIPNGAIGVGVTLVISSGSGKIQTTTDTLESVCDGQTLNDINSPFNGKVIPNLNADNRILKGSSISGAIANTILRYGSGSTFYNLNTINIIWIMRVK